MTACTCCSIASILLRPLSMVCNDKRQTSYQMPSVNDPMGCCSPPMHGLKLLASLWLWQRVINRFDGTTKAGDDTPGRCLPDEPGFNRRIEIGHILGIERIFKIIDRAAVDKPAVRIEEEDPR